MYKLWAHMTYGGGMFLESDDLDEFIEALKATNDLEIYYVQYPEGGTAPAKIFLKENS